MKRRERLPSMRKQTIVMPDGKQVVRTVRRITTRWYPGDGDFQLGTVAARGRSYIASRTLKAGKPEPHWSTSEEHSRDPRRTRRAPVSPEAAQWLDEAVEWSLLNDYGRRQVFPRFGEPYWTFGSATATEMNWTLFEGKFQSEVERHVGRPVPEDIEHFWDDMTFRDERTAPVQSALRRLVRRAVAQTMYGRRRGREVRVYFHARHAR